MKIAMVSPYDFTFPGGVTAHVSQLGRELGRLGQSEALGAEAVEGARQSLPDGHWRIGGFLAGYGETLLKLGRFAEAEAALLEAHEFLEAAHGPNNERTVKVIQFLVDLYTARHKAEPGAGYAAKAAEWRAKLPLDDVNSAP